MSSTVAKRPSRLLTGLEAFDRLVGGIPAGSVVLVAGKLGSGFDAFVQQILFYGVEAGDCSAVYLTAHRPPEDVAHDMLSRRLAVERFVAEQRWRFVDAYRVSMEVKRRAAGERALMELFRKMPTLITEGTWSAVDTLSFFITSFGYDEVAVMLDDYLSNAREKGGLHFLLLLEGLQDDRVVYSLAQSADGLLSFTIDPQQAEAQGSLRIVKLRESYPQLRLIPYRLTDRGIVIETVSRIT